MDVCRGIITALMLKPNVTSEDMKDLKYLHARYPRIDKGRPTYKTHKHLR